MSSPAAEWHHYTYEWDFISATALVSRFPVIEVNSPFPKGHLMAPATLTYLFAGPLVNVTGALVDDYNKFNSTYPYGDKLLLKDTVTTVHITQVGVETPEFPILARAYLVRPKYMTEGYEHTDCMDDFQCDPRTALEANRERFEMRLLRTWQPKDIITAASGVTWKIKVPCNRLCRTVTGRNATGPSSWGFNGSQAWFLVILHDDRTFVDGQVLNINIQQRITWIADQ